MRKLLDSPWQTLYFGVPWFRYSLIGFNTKLTETKGAKRVLFIHIPMNMLAPHDMGQSRSRALQLLALAVLQCVEVYNV